MLKELLFGKCQNHYLFWLMFSIRFARSLQEIFSLETNVLKLNNICTNSKWRRQWPKLTEQFVDRNQLSIATVPKHAQNCEIRNKIFTLFQFEFSVKNISNFTEDVLVQTSWLLQAAITASVSH